MSYVLIFAGIAVLLVVAVLVRNARTKRGPETPVHRGTAAASRTASGSAQRKQRKRRRAQSKHDRRKRH
jgi:septal ring-binding cell division protein DamX